MLWQKESSRSNALYVNIFDRFPHHSVSIAAKNPTSNKNDVISVYLREKGNELFAEQKWSEAGTKYNKSLCFAEPDSKNISSAYANRSTCFLKLQMYSECLIDIELAKKNGYPEHLMQKLDQRKADCLKHIDDGLNQDDFGLKLSFDVDEKFPCIVNVLKFQKDVNGEVAFFAKEDMDVGQTVAIDKAITRYIYTQHELRCNICLKRNTNLIPCSKCTVAMFYSTDCEEHFLHKYECGLKLTEKNDEMNGQILNEVRMFLMVNNMFSTADELMSFVEQSIESDWNEIPVSLTDEKSKYRAFLKLPYCSRTVNNPNFLRTVFLVYNVLLQKYPHIKSLLQSEKHRRFMMHLISMHALVADHNNYTVHTDTLTVCVQTNLIPRYFKHSCMPNVTEIYRDGHVFYITIRPVKKGDQLFRSVLDDLMKPLGIRQLLLSKYSGCKCLRCKGSSASRKQRQQIALDSDYQQILAYLPIASKNDATKRLTLTDHCVTFLRRYGNLNWCDEIGTVLSTYKKLLNHRLAVDEIR